jgi:hypothetical protein
VVEQCSYLRVVSSSSPSTAAEETRYYELL